MPSKRSHRDEKKLEEAVRRATSNPRIRTYFEGRFLEYLRWLENGSANSLILYYSLRIPAIVLAALVPALLALDLGSAGRTITVCRGR